MTDKSKLDVVVIGAGPYGLSAGAYLKASGMRIRVFGEPMDFWANQMPRGMLLRSPRAASTIADPRGTHTLEAFETESRTAPETRVRLENFVAYGRWFRRQLGPDLESAGIDRVERRGAAFLVTLCGGERFLTSRVVVAAGIGPFRRIPQQFQDLSPATCSHCYDGRPLELLAGKEVAIIGSGQSALESAALLGESGARVEVIARAPELRWIGGHLWLRSLGPVSSALYSKYDVGPAGVSRLVASPNLVHRIPLRLRDKIRTRAVRPAGAPWLRPRLSGAVFSTGRAVRSARTVDGRAQLELNDGSTRLVDHVLLATGYQVNIGLYSFLAPELVREVRQANGSPLLKSGFRSSVPGLHFVGATAARSFGPLLCFVAGTEFASTELAAHLTGDRITRPATASMAAAAGPQ